MAGTLPLLTVPSLQQIGGDRTRALYNGKRVEGWDVVLKKILASPFSTLCPASLDRNDSMEIESRSVTGLWHPAPPLARGQSKATHKLQLFQREKPKVRLTMLSKYGVDPYVARFGTSLHFQTFTLRFG